MAAEYYRLVSLYMSQDQSVFAAFIAALVLVLAYAFIRWVNKSWLTHLYTAVVLFLYAAANLIVMGVTL